jgi:hypothetical protein
LNRITGSEAGVEMRSLGMAQERERKRDKETELKKENRKKGSKLRGRK